MKAFIPLMRFTCRFFYCMNVARRFLTLPLRPHLPAFYIAGFPVTVHLTTAKVRMPYVDSMSEPS